MATIHMVERKMLNKTYKLGILLSVVIFGLVSFSSTALALNYGSGLYNSGIYSATIPSATATPIAGTYTETQSVTLATGGSNTIRYSTTATPADCTSATLYIYPIEVGISQIIYTLTCDTYGNSTPASFTYTIQRNTSSGSTVLGRYNNLLSMGNTEAALNLKNEFPNQIPNNENKTPVITPIIKTLKYKMTGPDVKILQVYLNSHGFTIVTSGAGSKGHETNYFGALTKKAVIKFQIANKLTPDGIVGPKTREVMNTLG